MDPHRLGLVSTRLQYFQVVARLGSIRRAAQTLNVSPSSISRMIGQLEEDLETKLFERVRQRLQLTSAGEILVYHARASISELARACNFVDDLKGLRRGTVSVAVVESVTRGFLPDALATFWKRHPDVTVDIKVLGSQQAFDSVSEGESDLAIAFDVKVPRFGQRLATTTLSIGALVKPDHRLAGRPRARLSDLAGERLILSDASLSLGSSVEEALVDAAVGFGHRSSTNSIALMTDLVLRGNGIAFQTRVGVEHELRRGDLVFVPISDQRLKPRKLLMISRSKAHLPESATMLAKVLADAMEQLPNG